jgi:cupin fold WbuC family metalloprotein
MQLINKELLDQVSERAKKSGRLRMNFNFHDSPDAKAQRLLNALEPGTFLPVHRHAHTAETCIVLRGKIKVFFYNDQKEISAVYELDSGMEEYGIHIPAGQWHTLKVLQPHTVIFEVKEDPYTPLSEKDIMTMETEE